MENWENEFDKMFPSSDKYGNLRYGIKYYFNTKNKPCIWEDRVPEIIEERIKSFISNLLSKSYNE